MLVGLGLEPWPCEWQYAMLTARPSRPLITLLLWTYRCVVVQSVNAANERYIFVMTWLAAIAICVFSYILFIFCKFFSLKHMRVCMYVCILVIGLCKSENVTAVTAVSARWMQVRKCGKPYKIQHHNISIRIALLAKYNSTKWTHFFFCFVMHMYMYIRLYGCMCAYVCMHFILNNNFDCFDSY